ncbi:agmatine deiminase [Campylobacterota bacterium]|nr:agmatine deiminase [Campylobacterota bacterium]
MSSIARRFPAEWEEQSGVLLALPHTDSDWQPYIDEILEFYAKLISAIVRFEKVLLVAVDTAAAKEWLLQAGVESSRIVFVQMPLNDTWARDFGNISIEENGETVLLDFEFNGWGLKFAANHDNQVNTKLSASAVFGAVKMQKMGWILEGGSIESDGTGTILTTENCLFAPNRNARWRHADFEAAFERDFGAKRTLWLTHGHLENDDTDAHIDTLARFCDLRTIAYTACDDPADPHYEELRAMAQELEAFRTIDGEAYRLIALPLPKLYFEGERLPATYANFLIINGAVITPIYGVATDDLAIAALKTAFVDREIIPLNAAVPTRQHGSIHCLTMQIPKAVPL